MHQCLFTVSPYDKVVSLTIITVMATTVNDAFAQFNRRTVNLDPDRTKVARSSRDWLIGQLDDLPNKVSDFPKPYAGKHIKFGSFARNTKIRPLDDIDIFFTFSASGTTYIKNGNNFSLTAVSDYKPLWELSDNGTLNSIKVINKMVSSLNKIEQYKAADKHRRGEAATLQLVSYEWNFDIVPAFYTDTGHYVIPDGKGGWQGTDPRIDQCNIDRIDAKHGGKVRQMIRTLKYWNERAMMTTVPTYLFENIILSYLNSEEKVSDYIDILIINFWYHLRTSIYNSVPDPKGFQGDLNTLTQSERKSISDKADDAYSKGYDAYKIETEEKDQRKAINKWREIFGDSFPKYE